MTLHISNIEIVIRNALRAENVALMPNSGWRGSHERRVLKLWKLSMSGHRDLWSGVIAFSMPKLLRTFYKEFGRCDNEMKPMCLPMEEAVERVKKYAASRIAAGDSHLHIHCMDVGLTKRGLANVLNHVANKSIQIVPGLILAPGSLDLDTPNPNAEVQREIDKAYEYCLAKGELECVAANEI